LLTIPGWLGVNLFFVLSGFLISGILIETRSSANYWQNFYTRRALRILPLYLAVLLILRLHSHTGWDYLLLCLLYLANFTSSLHIQTGYGPLWSLAVEEQFYLVWPFLVRRLSQRTLTIVCIGSIVLSPLLRYLSVSGVLPLGDPYTSTCLVTDNLAMGALIAIFLRSRAATLVRTRTLTVVLGTLGASLLLVGYRFHLMSRVTPLGAGFQPEPFILIFAATLLLSLQYGSHPAVFRFTSPLRFYGYISYGLYLLHLIFIGIFRDLFFDPRVPLPKLMAGPLLLEFCVAFTTSTLVCFLSRRYFEEYFLRLKDRLVPYGASSRNRSPQS
jgi:peptidoglycan/LPS O-acetylase OafA/YrhL